MDELKLVKWEDNFGNAVKELKIEFESYFQVKNLEDFYELRVEETGMNLSLVITDPNLPKHIKHRMERLLNDSKPEDSI
jgi:hypothetical protein